MDFIISLLALIILEIILGIDNLVFLSLLTAKLPKHMQKKARSLGLTFAWITRLILLLSAIWIMHMQTPIIDIYNIDLSIRDLFLITGGLFLLYKSTQEIHHEVQVLSIDEDNTTITHKKHKSFKVIILQIAFMDIIFSLDSVLTAVGLTTNFGIMATAITISILLMFYASDFISNFINTYPSIKMLALSFIMLIGLMLLADGFSFHVPRGYLYFAMAFSLSVEGLNLFVANRRKKKKYTSSETRYKE